MSATNPRIEIATATNPEQVAAVRRLLAAFAAEYDALVAPIFALQGFAAEVAWLPGRYAEPSGCLLLATAAGETAGCVALRDLGGGTCEMKRLYVLPASRGHQVGRLLVAAIVERGRALGYQRMVLDSLPEMGAAIALYEQFGFVATAPYWDHPTDHAVFMERALDRLDPA